MPALHRPYLAVMTPALVAYQLVKDNFVVQTLLYELITLSALAAACVGVIRYRPPRPRLWWFVIGGAGLTAVGDAVWAALRLVWHNDATPSLADIPYLASYPLIGAGLLVLIRSRTSSRDRAGLLDATIVAAGLFVLSWAFLIAPTAGGSDLTVLQRLATAAYPVGDVLLLALVGAAGHHARGPHPGVLAARMRPAGQPARERRLCGGKRRAGSRHDAGLV